MKAIVYTEYGPPEVLQLQEVAKPVPRDNEILVRVHAASVNYGDMLARNFGEISPRKFNMPLLFWVLAKLFIGVRKPRIAILGSEFAGEVAAAGKAVKRFKVGDAVFGYRGQRMGAYAEYLCLPENEVLAKKPANMTYEEAAAIPYGAIMALNLLRKIELRPGQKVLVVGASGGIGPALVQFAKYNGAEVTGVCGTPRLDYVRSLGADWVIDYTREDFMANGETYDYIVDILGKSSWARVKRALKPGGSCLLVSFKMKQLFQMLKTSWIGDKKVICALSTEKAGDLALIRELVEAGKIKVVIDKCYPLAQAAAAHRYAGSGQKKGSVVVTVAER